MARQLPTPDEMQQKFNAGQNDLLSESFLLWLRFFEVSAFKELSALESRLINSFVNIFLPLFTKDAYVITDNYAEKFIKFNPVISNIVALSVHENTDVQLRALQSKPDAFLKILVFLSARNGVIFHISDFFAQDAYLASLWYSRYLSCGLVDKLQFENLVRHLQQFDPRWQLASATKCARLYFLSTYIDPGTDKVVKQHINAKLKPHFHNAMVVNRPDNRKIAIVSARWRRGTAVYKTCAGFVEALREKYNITLIQIRNKYTDFDESLFSEIRFLDMKQISDLELSPVDPNEFALVYFTDIGMQQEDIYLSNLRFAPIQIAGYGHPVSTWGGEIDYWIGGRDTEYIDDHEKRYSERLVLIPGLGAINNIPSYMPTGAKPASERIVIDCPWSAQKCNYVHLLRLKTVLEEAKSKPIFRVFQGTLSTHNAFLPFEKDLKALLGTENVIVFPGLSYEEYMRELENGDFSIDSWPFGGCNTIIDSLWLGKPVVTLEGEYFYNRASSAILRQIGLEELVTSSPEEYVASIVKLVDDAAWRESIMAKLAALDLENLIFNPTYGGYFKQAVDYLIANHNNLKLDKTLTPILIE